MFHSEIDGSVNTIERNDSMQFETKSNGTVTKAKVKWLNPCEYQLQYVKEGGRIADSIHPYIASHPLNVKIVKTSSDYYIFEASMEGVKAVLRDTLVKDIE